MQWPLKESPSHSYAKSFVYCLPLTVQDNTVHGKILKGKILVK